jgi:LEA14-like dessication related protein
MRKMTEKNVIAVIILAIILSTSGFLGYIYYADAAAMSSIEVTINDVDITDVKFTSFKLKLDASIYNPTDQDISGLSSTFDIYIEDNYVGKGGFSNVFIPAHAQSEKDVSITIYYSGLADAAVDVIKNVITEGNFDLIISGNINGNVLFDLIAFSQEFETTHTYS